MKFIRRIAITLAVAALPAQFVLAEMEHRMGGLPGMPAHMLKPGGALEHHEQPHPVNAAGASMMFSFGQPGQAGPATRMVRIDAYDDAYFVPDTLRVTPGETVQFEVRNAGKRPHELRIGNHRYQQEHAEMLRHMPGWEHSSGNSVVVAPGKTAMLIWQFGDDPVVELACHVARSYETGMLVRVEVAKP